MVQTDGIDFGMYSQRPFEWYIWHAHETWKLIGDEEKNIPHII